MIDLQRTKIFAEAAAVGELAGWLQELRCRRAMLVHGGSAMQLAGWQVLTDMLVQQGIERISFGDFQPNPLYESVQAGCDRFLAAGCDLLIAVGGGSAIDVAKCIRKKLLAESGSKTAFLVLPTTAGTGSEATRYAVTYLDGQKQSHTDEIFYPDVVWYFSSSLASLPLYQKKAAFLDAYCHAVEACWSINGTRESRLHAEKALAILQKYGDIYIDAGEKALTCGETELAVYRQLFSAAYWAGRAIDITQTTAGHAMCYKMCALTGIAHGHGAALCVAALAEDMPDLLEKFFLQKHVDWLLKHLQDWGMKLPTAENVDVAEEQVRLLADNVNPVRLKNHPVVLSREYIEDVYRRILSGR